MKKSLKAFYKIELFSTLESIIEATKLLFLYYKRLFAITFRRKNTKFFFLFKRPLFKRKIRNRISNAFLVSSFLLLLLKIIFGIFPPIYNFLFVFIIFIFSLIFNLFITFKVFFIIFLTKILPKKLLDLRDVTIDELIEEWEGCDSVQEEYIQWKITPWYKFLNHKLFISLIFLRLLISYYLLRFICFHTIFVYFLIFNGFYIFSWAFSLILIFSKLCSFITENNFREISISLSKVDYSEPYEILPTWSNAEIISLWNVRVIGFIANNRLILLEERFIDGKLLTDRFLADKDFFMILYREHFNLPDRIFMYRGWILMNYKPPLKINKKIKKKLNKYTIKEEFLF